MARKLKGKSKKIENPKIVEPTRQQRNSRVKATAKGASVAQTESDGQREIEIKIPARSHSNALESHAHAIESHIMREIHAPCMWRGQGQLTSKPHPLGNVRVNECSNGWSRNETNCSCWPAFIACLSEALGRGDQSMSKSPRRAESIRGESTQPCPGRSYRATNLSVFVHLEPGKKPSRPFHIPPIIVTKTTEEILLLNPSAESKQHERQATNDQEKGVGANEAPREDD